MPTDTDTNTKTRKVNFEVGHRVVMSKFGRSSYRESPFNPHGLSGTIVSISGPFPSIIVTWDNNNENFYRKDHLDHL